MNRAFVIHRRVYTERDLEEAAARVASTYRWWERYGFQCVPDELLRAWLQRVGATQSAFSKATRRHTSPVQQLRLKLLNVVTTIQPYLGLEDRYVWAVSVLFGFIAFLLMVPLVLIIHPSSVSGVVAFGFPVVLTMTLSLYFLLPASVHGVQPSIEAIETKKRQLREEMEELLAELAEYREALRTVRDCHQAQIAYERAVEHHGRLERLLADERYRLHATDWRSLRDVDFENFLARVFRMLGYDVQTTKTSGDQGVDLIVRGKGRKIAVQVKGYQGSVGNAAVQQIYAGMVHYKCEECAAITNSLFTPAAVALARSVGCELIDGPLISGLIDGQIY